MAVKVCSSTYLGNKSIRGLLMCNALIINKLMNVIGAGVEKNVRLLEERLKMESYKKLQMIRVEE
jgi:hypothetical protein